MKIIETSIIIQASADRVWTILTNLDAYYMESMNKALKLIAEGTL